MNHELLDWINNNPYEEIGRLRAEEAAVRRATKWRLRDRLTELDMIRLVMAFQAGMATKDLADHYGLNVKSIRKVLREFSIKRRSRYDY